MPGVSALSTRFEASAVVGFHITHRLPSSHRTPSGMPVATDKPEIRWWSTSRITPLEDAV